MWKHQSSNKSFDKLIVCHNNLIVFLLFTALNDQNKYRKLVNIFLSEGSYYDRIHELAILELDIPFATDFESPPGYIIAEGTLGT